MDHQFAAEKVNPIVESLYILAEVLMIFSSLWGRVWIGKWGPSDDAIMRTTNCKFPYHPTIVAILLLRLGSGYYTTTTKVNPGCDFIKPNRGYRPLETLIRIRESESWNNIYPILIVEGVILLIQIFFDYFE